MNKNNNIEELIILLESFNIKDIEKYLIKNNYLFTEDTLLLAKNMSIAFNKTKDFSKAEKMLARNKYDIINKRVI